MANGIQNYKRLPLKSSVNARDMGGYCTEDGFYTNWRVFIRSTPLLNLDGDDRTLLRKIGLRTVIDLRSDIELEREPTDLSGLPEVSYIPCPLFVNKDIVRGKLRIVDFKKLYVLIAEESKAQIAQVFHWLAESEGACLFNCTAGKDRTGIIAALILSSMNVPVDDIVAEYQVSHTYIRRVFARIDEIASDVFKQVSNSDVENIEAFLDHLTEEYGGTPAYLNHVGVTDEQLAAIREKFLTKLE